MAKILVVDDEPDLVRFVKRALEADGHHVQTATDGVEGLRLALVEHPDLVVLDLLMPGLDGRAVLASLAATRPETKVMVLSATADVGARVDSLEAGAVDFLSKPFAVRELTARVRSRLRDTSEGQAPQVLRVGQLELDKDARRLKLDGREIDLSQREFLLLLFLMRKGDAVCSRQELLTEVWGYAEPSTNVVDVYVARLRRKMRHDLIQTVRNVGYQLQSS